MSDRASLIELADATLEAIARRDPASLPRSHACRYTENGQRCEFGAGLWASADRVRARLIVADSELQQAGVFAVVQEAERLSLLGLRLRAQAGSVTELEALVTREGQSSAFAPEALLDPPSEYEQSVATAERSARQTLRAVADSYFDGIEQNSSARVPFHARCERFENGVQTTGNPAFLKGMGCREQLDRKLFSYIDKVRARRYPVLDEERGTALACVFLDVPGTVTSYESRGRTFQLPASISVPRSVLLFELFKVSAGEIQRIDALMINLPYGAESGWNAA